MKHNNILKYLIALGGASLLIAGCQKELPQRGDLPEVEATKVESKEAQTESHILPGKVVVKLKPADLEALRAASDTSLRSASSAVQESLSRIGAVHMEPLFADYDAYRERRHRAGLDRWMEVTFEGEMSSLQAQQLLGETATFEYVELSYALAGPESKAVPATKQVLQPSLKAGANGDFNDPRLFDQWHYINMGYSYMPKAYPGADINLYDAWTIETGRPEVVVCVVDAGVDYEHEDLAAHVDLDRSFSFVYDSKTDKLKGKGKIESKSSDHGTHVAGTIAAINNNGIGVCGIAGGNGDPNTGVTIINAQVYGFPDERSKTSSSGIIYGADNGAVISQNSWGYIAPGPGYLPKYDKEAIDYFIKYAGCDDDGNQLPDSPMKGGVVIFAAGNDGLNYKHYPASYEECIAVASIGWGFKKAYYSNFGDYVDIVAPGGDYDFGEAGGVLSTIPEDKQGNKYGYMQGTSMACPHVSGVAALIVSKYGRDGFTNEMLKERLLNALRPYDINSFNPRYSDKLGVGCIDAAIALLEDGKKAPEVVGEVSVETNYTTADLSWDVVADEDAPNHKAYYYMLYVSNKEITPDNLKEAKAYKVYSDEKRELDKLSYTIRHLTDDTSYHYAIEAVDYFGNKSAQLSKGTFKTLKNAAPEVTEGLPKETLKIAKNQPTKLSLKVDDADQHNWSYQLKGDLYGIKHQKSDNVIEIEIKPIQATGEHQLTIILTDEYGKSNEVIISYQITQYQAVTPAKNLSENVVTSGQQGTIDLTPLFKHQAGATITYTVHSERTDVIEATVSGSQLTYTAKGKGRAIVKVTATDGITTAEVPLHFLVK